MVRNFLSLLACAGLAFCWAPAAAQEWVRLGPEGGQVISLAAGEKGEVFLGTTDGHVFVSADEGQNWRLRGHMSERWDAVVQAMTVDAADARRIFAGVRYQDPAAGGGVFWSQDGGATWRSRGLEGDAVRALVQWKSDAKVLVAGTRTGVFRTQDAGKTWEQISPKDDAELRNLDSIAIDPRDANVIYAGTFHLPWKTTDGGKHWTAIADGLIDDSDIMSLATDRTNPDRIFASACSGIYRSESGGQHWTKLEGIPYASRRTQQIAQDLRSPARWFAGMTEGLWETRDWGETWERVLGRETSVNALAFGTRTGVLVLGTDDGARVAGNGSERFPRSDRGFAHRVLNGSALQGSEGRHLLVAMDEAEPEMLESTDGGTSWNAIAKPRKAVVRLFAVQNRWVASLRGGGAAVFDTAAGQWKEWRFLRRVSVTTATKPAPRSRRVQEIPAYPDMRAVTAVGGKVIAATNDGLWSGVAREGVFRKVIVAAREEEFLDIVANANALFAVTPDALLQSADGGKTWTRLPGPADANRLLWVRIALSAPSRLLLGTGSGVFLGEASGGPPGWRLLQSGLPASSSKNGSAADGLWAISTQAGSVYVTRDEGANWERLEDEMTGAVRAVRNLAVDGVYLETRTDGIVRYAPGETVGPHSRNGTGPSSDLAKHDQ